jgi:hypothetical protein
MLLPKGCRPAIDCGNEPDLLPRGIRSRAKVKCAKACRDTVVESVEIHQLDDRRLVEVVQSLVVEENVRGFLLRRTLMNPQGYTLVELSHSPRVMVRHVYFVPFYCNVLLTHTGCDIE